MKYKKKVERLAKAQKWWDNQPNDFKSSNKRPGSIKQTTAW